MTAVGVQVQLLLDELRALISSSGIADLAPRPLGAACERLGPVVLLAGMALTNGTAMGATLLCGIHAPLTAEGSSLLHSLLARLAAASEMVRQARVAFEAVELQEDACTSSDGRWRAAPAQPSA